MGNRPSGIQKKLRVGRPNDVYEREADAVADQVMKMPDTASPGIHRAGSEGKEVLRMKPLATTMAPVMRNTGIDPGRPAPSGISRSLESSKGSGHSLPVSTREFMSRSMGADFSGVKIHTDGKAAGMNRSLRARAFTHGSDIYFDRGQYAPNTSVGKRLLAHELTHVVQQGKGTTAIQGDWQDDAEAYYEEAVKHYEEIKERGGEAYRQAEEKKDQLYQDGKEYYERALNYGERKWAEGEELWSEGSEKAGELWEEGSKDVEDWWYSGSGDVTKIEFNGRRVQVHGKDPYSAQAISGVQAGNPNIAEENLPDQDYTGPEHQHRAKIGPLPEGSYYVNPQEAESNPPATFNVAGWGKYRTRLHERTLTYVKRAQFTERDGGFFIHEDANKNGTAGCIGFLNNRDNFEVYKRIKNNSAQIPVEVKYTAPIMVPGTGPAEETG